MAFEDDDNEEQANMNTQSLIMMLKARIKHNDLSDGFDIKDLEELVDAILNYLETKELPYE